MAQRAYRSRKENTIQTLENQVEDLKKTNQEMTNAFVKLHDYAVDHGIDNMAPGFAQELKFMMDKFLSLARNSREATGEGSLDHESGDPEKLPQGHSEMHSSPETLDTPPSSKTTSSVLGYNFTHEIEIDPALSLDALRMPVERPYATTQTPPTYETVTMPTLENASFPFGTSTDTTFLDLFTDTSGAQATSTPTISPPLLSPFLSSLPAPASFAFNEISFGRRLQRSALQTGYRLITMPNPPADELARSFGFVLLFEPVDKIRERLRRGLEKTSAESLNYWPAPFWALGGAGQRSFGGSADGSATGNVGTEDVGKHDFDSTLGIGPFDIKTTDARDRRVDGRMRITLPGFEGEFFDPDEVEVYLRSRGVAIPPGQDYVTVEVDAHWLEEGRQGQTGVEQWAALSPDSGSTSLSEAPTTAVDDGSWATGTGLGGGGIFGDTASFSTSSGTSAAGKKLVTLDIDKFVRGKSLYALSSENRQLLIFTSQN